MTNVAQTSINAYRDSWQYAPSQRELILNYIKAHPGVTNREIHEATGIEMGAVCGRVNALRKDGFICVLGVRPNLKTGKEAQTWRVVA